MNSSTAPPGDSSQDLPPPAYQELDDDADSTSTLPQPNSNIESTTTNTNLSGSSSSRSSTSAGNCRTEMLSVTATAAKRSRLSTDTLRQENKHYTLSSPDGQQPVLLKRHDVSAPEHIMSTVRVTGAWWFCFFSSVWETCIH